MIINKQTLDGYYYVQIILTAKEDKKILDTIKEKAKNDAEKVNRKGPNGKERPSELIRYNNLGGVLAEEAVKIYLTEEAKNNHINAKVYSLPFIGHIEHRDIIIEISENKKTIEIRSSFQYLQPILSKVIKEVFSLIGPYTTSYKGEEPEKDFYIQVLHRYENSEIIDRIEEKVEVFIIGGGLSDLFKKIGEKTFLKQEGAEYWVIKPMNKTKGMSSLTKEILGIKETCPTTLKQKSLF